MLISHISPTWLNFINLHVATLILITVMYTRTLTVKLMLSELEFYSQLHSVFALDFKLVNYTNIFK